jgi:aminoglycoside phosphotransferase (APT) family kinase protein
MPATLVHGDLAAQNMVSWVAGGRRELVVLDWDKAGWGVPAVDLAHLSLADYSAGVIAASPSHPRSDLESVAWAGRLFRVLVHDFFLKPAGAVNRYSDRLWALLHEIK